MTQGSIFAGGLAAVIYTDALQTVIMVGGAFTLMFIGMRICLISVSLWVLLFPINLQSAVKYVPLFLADCPSEEQCFACKVSSAIKGHKDCFIHFIFQLSPKWVGMRVL